MSVTADGALSTLRGVLEAASLSVPLYWHGDNPPLLPDAPAAFAYLIFNNHGSGGVAAFGGGRGSNLYRNRGSLEAYVFAPPSGADGLAPVMAIAETIAVALRSFRDDSVSVYAADVIPVGPGSQISPPGLQSAVNNYLCAITEIDLSFDQIG